MRTQYIPATTEIRIGQFHGVLPYEIKDGVIPSIYCNALEKVISALSKHKQYSDILIQLRVGKSRVAFSLNTSSNQIEVVKYSVEVEPNRGWVIMEYKYGSFSYVRQDRIKSITFTTYSIDTQTYKYIRTGSLLKVMETGVFTLGGTPDKIDMVIAYK